MSTASIFALVSLVAAAFNIALALYNILTMRRIFAIKQVLLDVALNALRNQTHPTVMYALLRELHRDLLRDREAGR